TGNKELSFFFGGIADSKFWPEIEPHSFADKRERSRNHSMAGNNSSCGGHNDPNNNKVLGHEIVKRVNTQLPFHFGSYGDTLVVGKQVGALSEIVQQQAGFNIYPGDPDIFFAAMSQVAVKCFRPRCTEKYGAQQPEPSGIKHKKFNSIIRAESFKNGEIIKQM